MKAKHIWIRQQVLEEIQQGRYPHRLPSRQQLAQRFGVSVGTVSRALETLRREGWLESKRGFGRYACVSVTPRIQRVAFVMSAPADVVEHTYHGPLFRALCDVCAAENIQLTVAAIPVAEWNLLAEKYPNTAFYIVAPPIESVEVLTGLWESGVPFVVVGASWPEPTAFPTVDSDNRDGARRAVEYLLHLGHRRIACVSGTANSTNCRDRLEGYFDALRVWHLEPNPRWVIHPDSDTSLPPAARNVLVDLLLSREAPTAVYCAGYFLALEVLSIAEQLGISVPGRLSVLGTDDPVSARYLKPPLTTLRQPLQELGRRAAQVLLENARRVTDSSVIHEKLPIELVTRASCAPPAEQER